MYQLLQTLAHLASTSKKTHYVVITKTIRKCLKETVTECYVSFGLDQCFRKRFLLSESFWFRKITADFHILADVRMQFPDDGCPKLKFYTSELILCTYEYLTVKVKCTLMQALRICTGRTAHRGSRGIALLFLDHRTRRG